MSSLPDDKIDMIAATSVLQQQAGDIRQTKPNWSSYMQSQMISQEDYSCVSSLDKDKKYLQDNPTQCAKTLLNMLSHVSKDQTIQYILVLIDDLLQEDRSRVQIFHDYANKKKESVWAPFLNLLNRQDGFIVNMASRVVGKLACWGQEQMPKSDLHFYLQWLKDQLTVANNEYIQSVGRCLQMMLRVDEYRFAFVTVDGISTLISILSSRVNFQVQYQLVFCLWVLTFNPLLAEKMNKFWRENAQRLNEKNYELLRILVHLLETSKDPLVLSVASYDIGEYVRHYPRGKHVIEQLGGKQLVMQLLAHEDPNVRYEALLAVQKLMVHNWEYLGKQLEKETEKTQGTAPISGKA